MDQHFTPHAQNALNAALEIAETSGSHYIGSEHLLLGLLTESESFAAKILFRRGIRYENLSNFLEYTEKTVLSSQDMTPRVRRIIEQSALEALPYNPNGYVGTEHLLLALLGEKECVAVQYLEALGYTPKSLRSDILDLLKDLEPSPGDLSHTRTGSSDTDRKKTALNAASLLAKHAKDLTRAALEGKIDPIIGRDSETKRLIQILSRRQKNNPCLIGDPGVGKTAVVEGLALRIARGDVPPALQKKQVLQLDLTSMIAGAKYRGEFEERMKGILEETKRNTDLLLFIDEIHTIIGAGAAEGAVDAANILKPALARGDIQVIGATTRNEYRKHIEKDAALERRFLSVSIDEPNEETAIQILEGLRERYENHHNIHISPSAIYAAVHLSKQYLSDRFLPDKAIDILDEASSALALDTQDSMEEASKHQKLLAKLQKEKENAVQIHDFVQAKKISQKERQLATQHSPHIKGIENRPTLTDKHVAALLTQWTGIPVQISTDTDREQLAHLEQRLKEQIIGQDEAIESVARAIRLSRSGLQESGRPMGSFLFVGPSGSGKTELAKALSRVLFGSDKHMIRLDMSEYMERHSISRLIGSPPGYVGFEDGGWLTEKIRSTPYTVVLWDEIEKAHPDILNLLLQILDEGILTDAKGRSVSFQNSLLVLTSNLGSDLSKTRKSPVGFSSKEAVESNKEDLKRILLTYLRVEFLNRLDEIVRFHPLSQNHLIKITDKLLQQSKERMEALGYTVTFEPTVSEFLSSAGLDPEFGARPLKRKIQTEVEDLFSKELLENKLPQNMHLHFRIQGNRVVLETTS